MEWTTKNAWVFIAAGFIGSRAAYLTTGSFVLCLLWGVVIATAATVIYSAAIDTRSSYRAGLRVPNFIGRGPLYFGSFAAAVLCAVVLSGISH